MVRKKKEGIKLARPRSEVWQCVSVVYKTVLGGVSAVDDYRCLYVDVQLWLTELRLHSCIKKNL